MDYLGGGGQRVCWPPLQNYWGGPGPPPPWPPPPPPPPPPPLFTPMCDRDRLQTSFSQALRPWTKFDNKNPICFTWNTLNAVQIHTTRFNIAGKMSGVGSHQSEAYVSIYDTWISLFMKQRRFWILFCLHLAVRAIISSLRSEVRAIISSLKPIAKHQK